MSIVNELGTGARQDLKSQADALLASGQITQQQYDDAMARYQQSYGVTLPGVRDPGEVAGAPTGPNANLATADPNRYKMMQMHAGALGLQAYRPAMEQSRLNALQNQLGAFRPMNNALTSMYGPGMGMNLSAQSPLAPGQTSIGAPNTGDIGLQTPRPPQAPPGQAPGSPQAVGPQVQAIMRLLQGQ